MQKIQKKLMVTEERSELTDNGNFIGAYVYRGLTKKSFQLIPYGQKWVHITIQVIFNILRCKWHLKTSFCISDKVGRAWLCLTIDPTIPSGNIPDIESSSLIV